MMRLLVLIAMLAGLGPGAQAAPADEAWRRDGLANPWSAWLDVEHDIIYVANVAGDPQAKDGNGFIAQLDLKGEIVRRDWAIGLDAPKGISGMGGQLYVADIDRIVALDLATGAVTGTWPVPGAQALTDVYAAQRSGRVFVSDARTDTIWVLQDGQLKQFAHGPELRGPAGLRINRGRLVVAGMGDAIATWYEARTCFDNPKGRNMLAARPTLAAAALGELCAKILFQHGVAAVEAVKQLLV